MNLVPGNRFVKYLLYATGEIVLVVIGILIALAINNANVRQNLENKEQVYLKGLHDEFQTSRVKLKELIRVNRNNVDGARQLLKFMSDDSSPSSEKKLSEWLFSTFAYDIDYNPNNSLLLEMISSGSLKDLSNDTLRIQLTTWMATLDDINKQEDELRIQREKVVDMFRSENYSLRTVMGQAGILENELGMIPTKTSSSNQDILQSVAFENNLLLYLLTSHQTSIAHYEPLLADLEEILEKIEGEIIN